MTKAIETQLEKGRMFLKGMKRHIGEMGERGVSNRTIAQYEQDLTTLE